MLTCGKVVIQQCFLCSKVYLYRQIMVSYYSGAGCMPFTMFPVLKYQL